MDLKAPLLSDALLASLDNIKVEAPKLTFLAPASSSLEDMLGAPGFAQTEDENQASIARCVEGKYSGFRNFLELVGVGRGRRLIIVGGDPSIHETLPDIRRRLRLSKKTDVLALNKSDAWLRRRGVKPRYAAMCDPRDWVADYMTPQAGTTYLLASQLAERTLDKFVPFRRSTFIFHVGRGYSNGRTNCDWAQERYPGHALAFMPFGSTIGLLMIVAGAVMDFDDIEVHGFASCFHPEAGRDGLHAYPKPATTQINGSTTVRSLKTGDRLCFTANVDMARQALEFGKLMAAAPDSRWLGRLWRSRVHVAGRGVIPWLVLKDGGALFRHATPERMERFAGSFVDYRPEWAKDQPECRQTPTPPRQHLGPLPPQQPAPYKLELHPSWDPMTAQTTLLDPSSSGSPSKIQTPPPPPLLQPPA